MERLPTGGEMRPSELSANERLPFLSTDPHPASCPGRRPARLRLSRVVLATLAVIAAHASGLRAGETESPEPYEIVVSVAVPVLPPPVRAFFETHIDTVRQSATRLIGSTTTPGDHGEDSEWHYIMLDVAATGSSDRHEAALGFPHDRAAAERLFARVGVRRGGSLPWVVGDQHRLLVQAFAAGDAEAIARRGGLILHLSTDASLPLNTTRLHWANAAAGPRTPAVGSSHPDGGLTTGPHRFHEEVVQRLRERFDHEVRVWPGRYRPVAEPVEAVFQTLLSAHEALDEFLEIDAAFAGDPPDADGGRSPASVDAYYERLTERAASNLESRLEAGALLGADLIGGAWVEAGRPRLERLNADPARSRIPAAPPKPKRAPFVGSRNSLVFHVATCSHAVRIKPDNLVRFPTAAAARAAGRSPCKACRPNGG